ncbi:MAG: ImmA/IrrE family metallo-endopeptidase [Clostridia bacterium]|nr:ImmA/IrrE family metallo-endopeptidase [Clostridia bacterium]
MRAEYIRTKAAQLIAETACRDPFEAACLTGAQVAFKDLGSLKGAYFPAFKTPVIAVNQSLDDNTKKIVCAHELGHHILHSRTAQSCRELRFDSKAGILEREANIFAAAFLIDYDKALSLLKDGYTVDQTAAILETSTQLLEFLLSLGGIVQAPCGSFLK